MKRENTLKSDRIHWATDAMEIRPRIQILEIGCGDGRASEIICQENKSAQILAIDRSATAVSKAKSRLRPYRNVTVKKIELRRDALEGRKFDLIFCFNVNFFWTDPLSKNGEYEEIQSSLKKSGRLYVFYQTPTRKIEVKIIKILDSNLKNHGFRLVKTLKDPVTGSFGVVFGSTGK